MSNPTYDKVIRDGKVAVLYSPGYGAGWYSWNGKYEALLFHPRLVEMVEQDRQAEITEDFCKELLSLGKDDEEVYCGGAEQLEIVWLPVGARFRIHEYDGSESVVTDESEDWHVA